MLNSSLSNSEDNIRMDPKKKKRFIYILISVASLILILTVLNLFLVNRLEKYLERELVERTSKTSKGFYNLSFENLSISFLKGELRLEGISLRPDSAILDRWTVQDSLPRVYMDATIGRMDFLGINLVWRRNFTRLNFKTFKIESPNIKVYHTIDTVPKEIEYSKESNLSLYEMISPYISILTVKDMKLSDASLQYTLIEEKGDRYYAMDSLTVWTKGFELRSEEELMLLSSFHINPSEIHMEKNFETKEELFVSFNDFNLEEIKRDKSGYYLGNFAMQMNYLNIRKDSLLSEWVKDTTTLALSGVHTDVDFKEYHLDDISFTTSNLSLPVDGGFYNLNIGRFELKNRNLYLDSLHYVSNYPKMEFSYKHPKNSDWFDIKIGHLEMNNIDLSAFLAAQTLRMEEATVNDMVLRNLKNQKIRLPRRIVPMVYEGIQKAPIKMDIPLLHVNNFAVIYEELAQKGTYPGKLSITDVNGTVSGLTNIVSGDENQFIHIDANAKFMGKGDFDAIWLLPVDSLNDRFLIHAEMKSFNLVHLNEFITPLAGAAVESGMVYNLAIDMDASSKTGSIHMRLPYRDLKVNLVKNKDGQMEKNSFTSFLVNTVVRSNNPPNPDKPDSELRVANMTITRNPYHSTFNYLWQMIRPALTESAGISQTTQNFGKGVTKTIEEIKNFFTGGKDKPKDKSKKK